MYIHQALAEHKEGLLRNPSRELFDHAALLVRNASKDVFFPIPLDLHQRMDIYLGKRGKAVADILDSEDTDALTRAHDEIRRIVESMVKVPPQS